MEEIQSILKGALLELLQNSKDWQFSFSAVFASLLKAWIVMTVIYIVRLEFVSVEINKDKPKEKNKVYLFKACCNKGCSHHHLHFARDSKVGRGQRRGSLG